MKSKENIKYVNNQIKVIGIFYDILLKNRWKEYQRIHNRVMDMSVETPEYIDLCVRLRELEEAIMTQLSNKSQSLERQKMYAYLLDTDKDS